jgi:4-hydroxybenzoate polyprenyltransferase
MYHYLQLLRWPNLLIVALTMYLLHFTFLLPALQTADIAPPLSAFHFSLLMFMTLLATAAGYVVNDWFDYPIDVINKPDQVIINKRITWRTARQLYVLLIVIGALLSSYLSARNELWGICLIYNLTTLLLYLYARYLKRKPLVGNLVVALLCAMVTGLVWYIHLEPLQKLTLIDPDKAGYLNWTLSAYLGFSFLITLYREIVKDLEDMEGDSAVGARTIPIVFGQWLTKITASVCAFLLLVGLISFLMISKGYGENPLKLTIGIILLICLIISVLLLFRFRKKEDFGRLSSLLKFTMLLGLLWFLV